MNAEEYEEFKKTDLYRICNIFASVKTSLRKLYWDEHRKLGDKEFLNKYEVKNL